MSKMHPRTKAEKNMQINVQENLELHSESPSDGLDLFGADVTPEALESYMQSNYSTGAQASLMTALALATL
ncbi:hypothetical protein ACNOYE_08725 [Nannocystaceae bacterium ST9]